MCCTSLDEMIDFEIDNSWGEDEKHVETGFSSSPRRISERKQYMV